MNVRSMILVLTAMLSQTAGAVEVEGVKLTDTASVAGRELVLNGAGLREWLVVDVYVAALYLPAKATAAAAVLAADPRRVEIHMLRGVAADEFLDTLKEGMEANTSPAEFGALQPQIAEFAKAVTASGETKEGDTVTLDFVGGDTQVAINGVEKARIAGEGFNRALLKVWIGEHPAQADLKKAMLGG
jgi:long-chain acyl-CoA synthetase